MSNNKLKASQVKCIDTKCKKSVFTELEDIIVTPFDELTPEMYKLFSYFLHTAPNIASVHSRHIPIDMHSDLFNRMIENRHFKYQGFCSSNATIDKEFGKGYLSNNCLCLKCKRFVCKKRKTNKGQSIETDLNCFLRHIRNAIAHGRVYYSHSGNRVHIVFEDKNDQTGNFSARIVCIKADLIHWKRVLDNPYNYK